MALAAAKMQSSRFRSAHLPLFYLEALLQLCLGVCESVNMHKQEESHPGLGGQHSHLDDK